jgi:hypothetical protein
LELDVDREQFRELAKTAYDMACLEIPPYPMLILSVPPGIDCRIPLKIPGEDGEKSDLVALDMSTLTGSADFDALNEVGDLDKTKLIMVAMAVGTSHERCRIIEEMLRKTGAEAYVTISDTWARRATPKADEVFSPAKALAAGGDGWTDEYNDFYQAHKQDPIYFTKESKLWILARSRDEDRILYVHTTTGDHPSNPSEVVGDEYDSYAEAWHDIPDEELDDDQRMARTVTGNVIPTFPPPMPDFISLEFYEDLDFRIPTHIYEVHKNEKGSVKFEIMRIAEWAIIELGPFSEDESQMIRDFSVHVFANVPSVNDIWGYREPFLDYLREGKHRKDEFLATQAQIRMMAKNIAPRLEEGLFELGITPEMFFGDPNAYTKQVAEILNQAISDISGDT